MQVIWIEQERLKPANGHGADFATAESMTTENTIAVVRGFGWRDSPEQPVDVLIRRPDEQYSASFLADARQVIEEYLKGEREVVDGFWARGWLTPEIFVWLNC